MKIRLLLTVVAFLLSGCLATSSPPPIVIMPFPDVPEELKVACPDLGLVPTNTDKLSDVIDTVADNYTQYHDCRLKVDNWIEWYNTQKHISDGVK
jgi:ubiquitin